MRGTFRATCGALFLSVAPVQEGKCETSGQIHAPSVSGEIDVPCAQAFGDAFIAEAVHALCDHASVADNGQANGATQFLNRRSARVLVPQQT